MQSKTGREWGDNFLIFTLRALYGAFSGSFHLFQVFSNALNCHPGYDLDNLPVTPSSGQLICANGYTGGFGYSGGGADGSGTPGDGGSDGGDGFSNSDGRCPGGRGNGFDVATIPTKV